MGAGNADANSRSIIFGRRLVLTRRRHLPQPVSATLDRAGQRRFGLPRLDHLHRVYPDEARHILFWLAHRVQRPAEKVNHALVLGGAQGIGKDTLIEPVKHAVGPWNFSEVSPTHVLGRFNGFLSSVILRVSEARDLGEVNRYRSTTI